MARSGVDVHNIEGGAIIGLVAVVGIYQSIQAWKTPEAVVNISQIQLLLFLYLCLYKPFINDVNDRRPRW
ncbi:MAG TPA: hypothetical protein VKM55_16640 [Candidatus Lokiarchaeia archaeon]|nr:hypothetical protein [Candidatus Lokiarchaeia archaeon]